MKTIRLTRSDFDKLPNYSCTLPTGTTIGKQWKRAVQRFHEEPTDEWVLGEYIEHPDPGTVGISWRRILINQFA